MNDRLDDDIKRLLGHVVATTPEPPPLEERPMTNDHAEPNSTNRWIIGGGIGLLAAAAAIGLFVVTGDTEDTIQQDPAVTPAPTVPASEPEPSDGSEPPQGSAAPTSEVGDVPVAGSEGTSLVAMAGDVAIGDAFVVTYFNVDRYADGAGIEWVGDNAEDFATFAAGGSESAGLGEPFDSAFTLQLPEAVPIDLADVDANYDTLVGGGDVSLLVGDFDPDAVEERAAAIAADGDILEQRLVGKPSDVTEERYLRLADDGDPGDVVGVDVGDTALGVDGIEEITATLDEAGVYAAYLVLQGTPDDLSLDDTDASLAVGWDAAGFGTGFVDGDQHVTTVLWHRNDDDAQANATALMAENAGCVGDVEVEVDGRLVRATCPVDEGGWTSRLAASYPQFPPQPTTTATSTTTTGPADPAEQSAALTTAGDGGVTVGVPEGSESLIITEPMAFATTADDGRIFVQRSQTTNDPDADTTPLVYSMETSELTPLEMPRSSEGSPDDTIILHDVATVDGDVTLLYETQPGNCANRENCVGAIMTWAPDTGESTEIVSQIVFESGWSGLELATNGLIVGSQSSEASNGIFLASIGSATPPALADLGLEESYFDCGVCPFAYTVDPSGRYIGWVDSGEGVTQENVDPNTFPSDEIVVVDISEAGAFSRQRVTVELSAAFGELDIADIVFGDEGFVNGQASFLKSGTDGDGNPLPPVKIDLTTGEIGEIAATSATLNELLIPR